MTLKTQENLEQIALAQKVMNETFNMVVYLLQRWNDEKEFEKGEDWAFPIWKIIRENEELSRVTHNIKMTFRPFGFKFTITSEGKTVQFHIHKKGRNRLVLGMIA